MKDITKLLSALVLGSALTGAMAAPDWPVPPGVKTVEVNGYPVAYAEAGAADGVPLVILHGAWVDHRFFAPQVTEFSKTHRVISVSLRHYFPEAWDGKEGAFSVQQHADDVAALIRQLKLGKAHILGHSRGGAVAIAVARQAPEVIRTLILEDAGGLEPLLADDSVMRQRVDGSARLAVWVREQLNAGERRKTAQAAWELVFGAGAWERMSAEMQQSIADNIGTMAAKTPYDVPAIGCDDIRKFAFPVLILNGERSPKLYGDMSAAMRQCKPDLAVPVIVPEAAHNMHFNNPAFFNKAVLDFMQRN